MVIYMKTPHNQCKPPMTFCAGSQPEKNQLKGTHGNAIMAKAVAIIMATAMAGPMTSATTTMYSTREQCRQSSFGDACKCSQTMSVGRGALPMLTPNSLWSSADASDAARCATFDELKVTNTSGRTSASS